MSTTSIEPIIDQIQRVTRFQLHPEARVDLYEILDSYLADSESAYTTAHKVCEFLEVKPSEFSYAIQQVLKPVFD